MRPPITLAIALSLCAMGCAAPEGVDLRLVADPNVNLESQVLAEVDSIVLVVDSPDGLYPPGEERASDGVQIENADSDPALEVVATVGVPEDHLPVIRLHRGSLPDASLELRLLGLPAEVGGTPTAIGRVQGARLSSPIEELDVPFNLLPELLPPRVTEVLPGDGESAPGCEVPVIVLMFSTPMDEASLAEGVSVTPGEVTRVALDPSGRTAQIELTGTAAEPPMLTYRIALAESVTDRRGRPLDQIPSEPGDQAFAFEAALTCGPGMAIPDIPCETATPPQVGMCPFPMRFTCVDQTCLPTSCVGARCDEASVCDPATGRCEPDCRLWGEASICPEARPTCDAETGACI